MYSRNVFLCTLYLIPEHGHFSFSSEKLPWSSLTIYCNNSAVAMCNTVMRVIFCRISSKAQPSPSCSHPLRSLGISYSLYSGFFFPNIKSIVSAWPNSLRISNSMTLFSLKMTMYFESLFFHFLFILFCPSFAECVSSSSITVVVIVWGYRSM